MGPYTPELRRQPLSSSSTNTETSSTVSNNQTRLQSSQSHQQPSTDRSSNESASQPSSSSLLGGGRSTSIDENGSENWKKIKCVLVGDAAVGKTSLIVSYTTDGYPQEYVPTAFDNYTVSVRVDGQPVKVQLCDTAGQDDFDALRPLCYPYTDVFLLCFSVVNPTSFHNIAGRWLGEIRRFASFSATPPPLLLVGTESDLRTNIKILIDLSRHNRAPISSAQARSFAAQTGAIRYIECSSLTQLNLKDVFDSAILAALKLPVPDEQDEKQRGRVQVHEFRGRKSLRKWKNKLVTRSTSADSMKHLRVRRSASSQNNNNNNNNNKLSLSNAQSIGRLNYICDTPPSMGAHDSRRNVRPSYAAAMHSASPSLWNMKFETKCEKKKFSLSNASGSSHRLIGMSPSKSGNVAVGMNTSDLSKAKKGWKKLLCVV